MSQFCGTPFLDEGLWNQVQYPDASPCFQNVVCYIFPSLFLMTVSTCRFYHICYSKKKGLGNHWLATVQTMLCACLVVPPLADMFRTVHDVQRGHESYVIDYLTAIIRTLAMVLAAVIIQIERRKAGRYFIGLFAYWVLLTLTGAFVIYSKIRTASLQGYIDDKFRLATFIIYYVLVLIQLVLSFVPNPYIAVNKNSSPEMKACCASRLTFWWFNTMIMKGYKTPLQYSDLHDLNEINMAGTWVPNFEKHWARETRGLIRSGAKKNSHNTNINLVRSQELDPLNANGKKLSNAPEFRGQAEVSPLVSNQPPEGASPSLVKCLAIVFLPSILICAALKLVYDLLLFVQPIILRQIIQFVLDPNQPGWRGYVYASVMFLSSIVQTFLLHQYFHKATVIGMRLRATICASVYNKALKLTSSSRKESTVGEVVNLMSVDAQRFMDIMTYLNTIWSAPLQILIALIMLWQILGPAVLAGFAVMVLMIPFNIFITNRIKKLQVTQMKEKDNRIKLMSEILNGIKVLKLYAWELSFCDIINKIREKELDLLKKAGYISAISTFAWQCTPFFVALLSFTVYVISDETHVLNAEKAFVSLSLFNIIRFPMAMLPHIITSLVQTSVSVNRIAKFLSLEELNTNYLDEALNKVDSITLKQCTFSWEGPDSESTTLEDISVNVKRGELVAVVGVVGSGKSSLISGLLGDMAKLKGHVFVDGTVAYVSQQAWIQNATLRDNIVFGAEFDQTWYDEVLEACALLPDLSVLPAGDMTEIGEKGINLSGGQKQRVSLARAVYSKADIYYLDDPLSAVDAHVGKHIFDRVIGHSGLLKGKTRLLVTHGISYLPKVDNILVIKDGKLSESGSFTQLMARKQAFAEFLKTYFTEEKDNLAENAEDPAVLEQMNEVVKKMNRTVELDDISALVRERLASISSMRSAGGPKAARGLTVDHEVQSMKSSKSILSVNEIHPALSRDIVGKEDVGRSIENFGSTVLVDDEREEGVSSKQFVPAKGIKADDKLIEAEKSQEGRVKVSVFTKYITAMGWIPAVAVIFFFALDQGSAMGANVWLSKWSDDVDSFNVTSTRNMYLGVYASFGVMQGLFISVASYTIAMAGVRASTAIHHKLIDNILRCPLTMFEVTPIGRFMNRFSSDMATVDFVLPFTYRSMVNSILGLLLTIAVVGVTLPWILLVAAVLAVPYIFIQVCLFALVAMTALAIGSWQASGRLHGDMLNNIVRCSMNFFDTTPTGRILNRFAKDVDVIDTNLPANNRSFIWCLMAVLGTIIIISISTPWFLLVVIPLFIIYILIQRFYIATTRQLKRIESVNLSPIYSHFEESIQGAATIRAFNKQRCFMDESLSRVDKHQQAYYPIIISNRWLAVRLEFLGSCIVLSAVLLAVISRNTGTAALTAGIAGLSISYSLNVTNALNWLVRMTSELENNVVAVERIKEYSEVKREADWIIDINRPLPGWPSIGSIIFDGYSVRYREGLDLVLKDISCTITGGEKVGICGRTGAGKSSLTLALFRILEGAEGAIYIDDVRIGAIGLHDLRNALTIIPQDPVVFSGPLRMNLDPFDQYTDDRLWEVLEQVSLKTFVMSLQEGLDFACAEGGSNLSVGQRQLICLGRALLRHTKILILDEATAAVDLETDDLIQSAIKTAFADCTVLTIAHRLNTIIDYDRVMVLDAGEIKEFAPPQELLAKEDSIFYSLAKQSNIVS